MRKLFKGRSTERDAFRIPRSVQQSIPIKRIYKGRYLSCKRQVFQDLALF